ncbi:MAG: NUDIX domain-containing protein [Patescibacteria group bacterium]
MPHLHDKIDFTVEVFIVFRNKVLLRRHDKFGIWLSVGGHIEPDEDPNQAAIREVKEEVGLDITLDDTRKLQKENPHELIPPYFLSRHHVTPTHEHITFIYFARTTSDKITQTMLKEQSDEIRWFTKKELLVDTEILSEIKNYALAALTNFTL